MIANIKRRIHYTTNSSNSHRTIEPTAWKLKMQKNQKVLQKKKMTVK